MQHFYVHICISAKYPESPAVAAKDKSKRQEINETAEGNLSKNPSFVWLFSPCAFVINQCVQCIVLLNGSQKGETH